MKPNGHISSSNNFISGSVYGVETRFNLKLLSKVSLTQVDDQIILAGCVLATFTRIVIFEDLTRRIKEKYKPCVLEETVPPRQNLTTNDQKPNQIHIYQWKNARQQS